MWYFIGVVFRVTLIISGVCAGMIGYGRSHPQPIFVDYLDSCKGRMCLFGIVPGNTSWGDAQVVVSKRTGANINDGTYIVTSNHVGLIFNVADDNKSVGNIELT